MPEMKDSGIEWIGEISDDFQMIPLKYLLESGKSSVKVGPFGSQLSGTDLLNEESDFWVYNQRSVIDENSTEGTAFISEEKYKCMPGFQVHEGDILITTRGTIGRIFKIPSNFNKGIIHPCIIKFRIDERRFNYKLLRLIFNESDLLVRQLSYKSNATTIDVIYSDTLRNIYVPTCSMEMQKKLADFLDSKCSEIDALTADIQKEIEVLEEYKKSVITEAVTKGLAPDAETKDSGIEWIGEIPKEWSLLKAKYIFIQRNQKGNEISLQLLSPTQKYGVIPQTLYEELTTNKAVKLKESVNLAELKTIHKGDYCISLRSFQGGFEYSEYEGVVSPAYQVFYPIKQIADGYYKYMFKDIGFIEKMNSYTLSLRDGKNIAFSDFGNTCIPVPPLTEQARIADFLDNKCSEIDRAVAEKREQLTTLEEYKKSVIYEYVTGKREVTAQ